VAADYGEVHDAYAAQRPNYKDLATLIGTEVERRLDARGLEVIVQWRAKDTMSFVKKALRKDYVDPLGQIGDKAGVRVIVHYLEHVPIVQQVVDDICYIHDSETKLDALDYDKLGYLGVHLEVQPRPELVALGANDQVADLRAELQIHTKAQSAWAVVSHDLLYKPPVSLPGEAKRSVTRLVALVELFDAEVERLRQTLRNAPDFKELMVTDELDNHIIKFTAHKPDKALSALTVPALVRTYDVPPEAVVAERVEPFIERHETKLRSIYTAYEDDTRANPLLFQPEALLLFERFESAPDDVRAAWPGEDLPVALLYNLALIWGADIGEGEAV
jgi:ppGpp synthetase/RelA/SpoT-type nucleotidyltranferase